MPMHLCVTRIMYTQFKSMLTTSVSRSCRSMLNRGTNIAPASNGARFKQLFVHCLQCGDSSCTTPGCLASRDVLLQALECDECDRVGGGACREIMAIVPEQSVGPTQPAGNCQGTHQAC